MAQPKRYSAEQFKHCLAEKHAAPDEGILVKDYAPTILSKAEDVGEDAAADRIVQFVISTGAVDRDGDTIDPNGWDLVSFQKAGAILWGHRGDELPIAQSLGVWIEEGKLKAKCRFPERDVYAFADTVYQLIKAECLRCTSVGFKPKTWEENGERVGSGWGPPLDFKSQELLEYSVVSVPANPEALVEAKSLGIDMGPYVQWAEKTLDMMAVSGLLVPRNAVEKAYFAAKGATSSAAVPGKVKAGRVLSTKNLDRLTSAQEAIQEVIDSAGSIEDEEDDEEDKGATPAETSAPASDEKGSEGGVECDFELAGFFEMPKSEAQPEPSIEQIAVTELQSTIAQAIAAAFRHARGQ